MKTISHKIKISFLIFSCVLLNFSSGCGKPVIKSEKNKAQIKEVMIKRLLERHQTVTAELKIIKDKLDEAKGQMNISSAKMRHGHLGTHIDKNRDLYDSAKIEANDMQIKYDKLKNELKGIELDLYYLGYTIEKPSSQPNKNRIMLKTK